MWAVDTIKGKTTKYLVLHPSRAYMDDITILVLAKIGAEYLLQCYHSFFIWLRMKIKAKKNWSLLIFRGAIKDTRFHIGDDVILTVRENW